MTDPTYKSWDEFAAQGAPQMDFVVTMCDQAAGEMCTVWPGQPLTAYWGMPDPAAAAADGSEEARSLAFKDTVVTMKRRLDLTQALPLANLDRKALHQRVRDIGGLLMDATRTVQALPAADGSGISFFEKYLTVWVALCIGAGVLLGQLLPGAFRALASLEIAKVNVPVGLLIWVMVIPMLLKVDFSALGQVKAHARGIGVTLFVNWAIKPFTMALLGWVFIKHLLAPWLPEAQLDSYVAGLILLAAAPCTAMVFVWSQLCKGDPYFTLSQVALNDAIMVIAFAPLVALLLGISSISVPWDTLLTSVGLYIMAPVIIAQAWRKGLLREGPAHFRQVVSRLGPFSMAALLLTLVLLFAFQGQAIIEQPMVIALLAVPILFQVVLNSGLAYLLNRRLGVQHCVAGPSALIGASNFFELAVATAISLFGFKSGAALATVVGVLVEVPIMLAVVAVVNNSQRWYERRSPSEVRP